MRTHKWLSNSAPLHNRASQMNLADGEYELSIVKSLGILWDATTDVFTFKSQYVVEEFTPTKRIFLKGIATLFDPLGFLSPYIIRAKILMQSAWICRLDWDDSVPEDLATKMISWFMELPRLPEIKVPRRLQLREEVKSVSVHVFVDASEMAYGAVVYLRFEYKTTRYRHHL